MEKMEKAKKDDSSNQLTQQLSLCKASIIIIIIIIIIKPFSNDLSNAPFFAMIQYRQYIHSYDNIFPKCYLKKDHMAVCTVLLNLLT